MNIQSGKLRTGEPFIGEFPDRFTPQLGRNAPVKILDPCNITIAKIPDSDQISIQIFPMLPVLTFRSKYNYIEINIADVMFWYPKVPPNVEQAYCQATGRKYIIVPELVVG